MVDQLPTLGPTITQPERQEMVELNWYQPHRGGQTFTAFPLDRKSNSPVLFTVPGLLRTHTPRV